jgi:C-terminal processing protease CtpA/Prc
LRRALTTAATDPGDAAFAHTLQRLVAALQDGQARMAGPSPPQNFRLPLLWDWIEGRLVVTAVLPKQTGNVVPGDVILSLNGQPAEEALAAAEALTAAATADGRRFAAVRSLLTGAPFEAVQVEVQPFRGEPLVTTLIRSISPEGDKDLKEPRPEPVAEMDRGVLYLDLIRMSPLDFRRAMQLVPEASGIVFDVRAPLPAPGMDNNIRRFLPLLTLESLEMPRRSLAAMTRPDQRTWQELSASYLSPQMPHFEGRVAFLVNGAVIGELEAFLTLVDHYRFGILIGTPTAGTIGEVSSMALPGGYAVYWTGVKTRKQDGSRHHGVGIEPMLNVVRSRGSIAAGRDEVLDKALALVTPPVLRREEE